MFNQLYSLKTQTLLNFSYYKFIGFFIYTKLVYIVFYIGSKKYIYFPADYFKKNILWSQNYFIFQNIYSFQNIYKDLQIGEVSKKINFLNFFLKTNNYFKKDKLRISLFSSITTLKNKIKYSFYLSKTKNFKFCLFSNFKIIFLNKIITNDNFKLLNFVVNFKYRFIYFYKNSLILSFIIKKNNIFFIPKFVKKYLLKKRIKKNYLLY